MAAEDGRVIALIDMDCFYVQVEERENPQNKGKPACVVQYKKWKGGGIISVNYEARAMGITKQMRGDEAREKCPDCILYRVPEQRGKADLTRYRDGGKEVIDVMCEFGVCVERASIDEAYIDMTSVVNQMLSESTATVNLEELPNTHVVGLGDNEGDARGVNGWLESLSNEEFSENDWKLTLAAVLCEKMRAAVYEKTGFRCSAGIAANKMLAKLACGIHKPNKQTILPMKSVPEFFKNFPLKKVRHLGGKLGLALREDFNCVTMNDIANISEQTLQERFDSKTGAWLYLYARGVDHETVSDRRLPKSIGCNKNFTGLAALDTKEKISHWLLELCAEVVERLDKDKETNNRTAKLLTLTVRLEGDIRPYSYTRSLPLPSSYDKERMAKACLAVMSKENPSKQPNIWSPVVTCLGVSASKFVDQIESKTKIDRFFFIKPTSQSKEEKYREESPEKLKINDELHYSTSDHEEEEEEDGTHSEEALLEDHAQERVADEESRPILIPENECILSLKKSGERNNESEDSNRNNINIPKRTGFFASRNLKTGTSLLQPKPQETQHSITSAKEAEKASLDQDSFFSIEELFPDLDRVDMETVAVLPVSLRRQVLQKLEALVGQKQNDNLVTCEKCEKQLLPEEVEEHRDFHVAKELQEEFSSQPSTSRNSNLLPSKSQPITKKSTKRSLKDQKKTTNKDSKRSRTIDSFFSTSS